MGQLIFWLVVALIGAWIGVQVGRRMKSRLGVDDATDGFDDFPDDSVS